MAPVLATLTTDNWMGKQRDFEAVVVPYTPALYNFALRLTADEEDARDLVQETMLKAYRFYDSFEKGTNMKAWLFRILKNSFINKYRKMAKEPNKIDYDEVKDYFNSVRDESVDPNNLEDQLFGDLLDDDVTRALQSLPPDFRTVVILCDMEGQTYEEIADMVGCPVGTVRSRLHRGRKMLFDKLKDYAAVRGYAVEDGY
ncbi:MAG: sigma-70 family RNA polymerase sigma factor [Bacteroidetes bacterium]|nr:sigma-70 family RNA polymerase sigma factor [Bacteroidota bacterium]